MKKKGRFALALSGGGITGALYEVGCLTALDDFFSGDFSVNEFDIFIGVSSGSVLASLVSQKVKPSSIFKILLFDTHHPLNFRRSDLYRLNIKGQLEFIRKILQRIFDIIEYYRKNKQSFSFLDALHAIEENLPQGFFNLDRLDAYMKRVFSHFGLTNEFKSVGRELYIPAVDLDTGWYHVFGEGEFSNVEISKAIMASCAIPIFFEPVKIKDIYFVDGGLGREAYLDIAVDKKADLVLVINPLVHIKNEKKEPCIPTFYGKCSSISEKGLSYIAEQALRISSDAKTYLHLKRMREKYPEKDFIVIEPDPEDLVMFSYNIMSVRGKDRILKYGYDSAENFFRKNFNELRSIFDKYGICVSLENLGKEKHM